MKVIEISHYGGPDALRLADRPLPEIGPREALVRVFAAGVNRPDVQQRKGLYPPPPGASDIPGLDIAGVVEAVGAQVSWPAPGEAVCALASGGGYADYCAVPAVQCMPAPRGLSFIEAASLPEVFFTAWNNVIWLGALAEGETLLVQGGTSGVGMAAIQLAKRLRRARVFATAGTQEKCRVCREIGADEALNYRAGDWDSTLRSRAGEAGVNVILDGQAGDYAAREMALLAPGGRLVLIASHRGAKAEIDLRDIVRRRLTLTGSVIRPRSSEFKGRLAAELVRQVWPLIEDGRIRTHIHAVLPLADAAAAHAILDANQQIGKVVLALDSAASAIP